MLKLTTHSVKASNDPATRSASGSHQGPYQSPYQGPYQGQYQGPQLRPEDRPSAPTAGTGPRNEPQERAA
jgi:hypothetical protein